MSASSQEATEIIKTAEQVESTLPSQEAVAIVSNVIAPENRARALEIAQEITSAPSGKKPMLLEELNKLIHVPSKGGRRTRRLRGGFRGLLALVLGALGVVGAGTSPTQFSHVTLPYGSSSTNLANASRSSTGLLVTSGLYSGALASPGGHVLIPQTSAMMSYDPITGSPGFTSGVLATANAAQIDSTVNDVVTGEEFVEAVTEDVTTAIAETTSIFDHVVAETGHQLYRLFSAAPSPSVAVQRMAQEALNHIPEVQAAQQESYETIKNVPSNDVITIGGHNSATVSSMSLMGTPLIGSNQFMTVTQQLQSCRGASTCVLDIDMTPKNTVIEAANIAQAAVSVASNLVNPAAWSKLVNTVSRAGTAGNALSSRHAGLPIDISESSTVDVLREVYEFSEANPNVKIDIRVENNGVGPSDILKVIDAINPAFKGKLFPQNKHNAVTLQDQVDAAQPIRFILQNKNSNEVNPETGAFADTVDPTTGAVESHTGFAYQGAFFVRTTWAAATRLYDAAKAGDQATFKSLFTEIEGDIDPENFSIMIDWYESAAATNTSTMVFTAEKLAELQTVMLPAIKTMCGEIGMTAPKGATVMLDQLHPLHAAMTNEFNKVVKSGATPEQQQGVARTFGKFMDAVKPLYEELEESTTFADSFKKLADVTKGERAFGRNTVRDLFGVGWGLAKVLAIPIFLAHRMVKNYFTQHVEEKVAEKIEDKGTEPTSIKNQYPFKLSNSTISQWTVSNNENPQSWTGSNSVRYGSTNEPSSDPGSPVKGGTRKRTRNRRSTRRRR